MEEEEQKQKMRFSGHWGDLRLPLLRRSGGGPRQGRSQRYKEKTRSCSVSSSRIYTNATKCKREREREREECSNSCRERGGHG